MISLDGKTFRDVTGSRAGDVGSDTVFEYHEDPDGVVWARYRGGAVRLGFLVGSRIGDELTFRYNHVTSAGDSAGGRCASQIEVMADGLLRLHESWHWESRPGRGESTLEEVRPGAGTHDVRGAEYMS